MKLPCQNLTISRVTSKDMGTKFVKMRIQVPTFLMKRRPQLEFHLSEPSILKYDALSMFSIYQVVPIKLPMVEAIT